MPKTIPLRAADLFEAFAEKKLPSEQGCIITAFFDDTGPALYELFFYHNIKALRTGAEGLVLQGAGKKLPIKVDKQSAFVDDPVRCSSYRVIKPRGINFALVFYPLPDMRKTLSAFLKKTLEDEAGVAPRDAAKIAAQGAALIAG